MYRTRLIVSVGVLLPLLLWLGCWQLDRHYEKLAIEENLQLRHFTTLSVDHLRALDDPRFYPLTLTGRFDNSRYFLLDNRIHQGVTGFHVLMPFITNDSVIANDSVTVLVDRGWIAGFADRSRLPEVPEVKDLTTITGQSWQPAGNAFLLKDDVWQSGWPKVIQAIDNEALTKALATDSNSNPESWLLILDNDQPGSLQRNFQPTAMPAERHFGYAIQWFTMAFSLVLLAIWALYKERENKNKKRHK